MKQPHPHPTVVAFFHGNPENRDHEAIWDGWMTILNQVAPKRRMEFEAEDKATIENDYDF